MVVLPLRHGLTCQLGRTVMKGLAIGRVFLVGSRSAGAFPQSPHRYGFRSKYRADDAWCKYRSRAGLAFRRQDAVLGQRCGAERPESRRAACRTRSRQRIPLRIVARLARPMGAELNPRHAGRPSRVVIDTPKEISAFPPERARV